MLRSLTGLAVLAAALLAVACGPAATGTPHARADASEVVVFAAASLTDAFAALGAAFEAAHPEVRVTFNYAGSQQLAQQLVGGAPGDVFAAANQAQMEAAIEAGRVEAPAVQPFVLNHLVAVVAGTAPVRTLADLAAPGVKLVLADSAVPVGQYALDFLDKAAADPAFTATYRAAVLGNVVSYEENARAVLNKVVLGEADAGIVYASDVAQVAEGTVRQVAIPDRLNVVATYPIAPVADSHALAPAAAFVDFVLSPQGQQILEDYGFSRITP